MQRNISVQDWGQEDEEEISVMSRVTKHIPLSKPSGQGFY